MSLRGPDCAESSPMMPSPFLLRVWFVGLVATGFCNWWGPASAQDRKVILPLTEFMNSAAVDQVARIVASRDWAKKECPRHLASNMWLSPLGDAYIASVRSLEPAKFQERVAANATGLASAMKDWSNRSSQDVAREKDDLCQELWTTFLVIEDSASKAYWTAGWQPKKQ